MLITKGAPEAVLARCVGLPVTAAATLQRLFADGERVVAVATRDVSDPPVPAPAEERDLRLAGFLTFVDRPQVVVILHTDGVPRCDAYQGRCRYGMARHSAHASR